MFILLPTVLFVVIVVFLVYTILHILYFITLHSCTCETAVYSYLCWLKREMVLWQSGCQHKANPLRTLARFSTVKRDFLLREIDPSLWGTVVLSLFPRVRVCCFTVWAGMWHGMACCSATGIIKSAPRVRMELIIVLRQVIKYTISPTVHLWVSGKLFSVSNECVSIPGLAEPYWPLKAGTIISRRWKYETSRFDKPQNP